jgi:hypothetical protein
MNTYILTLKVANLVAALGVFWIAHLLSRFAFIAVDFRSRLIIMR